MKVTMFELLIQYMLKGMQETIAFVQSLWLIVKFLLIDIQCSFDVSFVYAGRNDTVCSDGNGCTCPPVSFHECSFLPM